MKKRLFIHLTILFFVSMLFVPRARAAHPDVNTEIENLKRRIEQLEKEKLPPEEKGFALGTLERYLSFHGLVELEVSYTGPDEGPDESDVSLATAEFGVEAHLNEQVGAHVTFLYEEPEPAGLEVDEAVITLHCPREYFGLHPFVEGGKFYVPFGRFDTAFVSDPLTLELGETNHTALLIGAGGPLVSLNLGAIRGRADLEEEKEGVIDTGVFSLDLHLLEGMDIGLSYLTDLAESDAELVGTGEVAGYTSDVPAVSAFFSYHWRGSALEFEYLSAVADFDEALVGGTESLTGRRPAAWNAEISWQGGERWLIAAKAEGADDFRDNEKRYGAAGSVGILPRTVLALEYLYSDVETAGEDSHNLTAQLAVQF